MNVLQDNEELIAILEEIQDNMAKMYNGVFELYIKYGKDKTIRNHKDFIKEISDGYVSLFEQLYILGHKLNYKWDYCSSDTYKYYFKKSFEFLKESRIEYNLIDHIEREKQILNRLFYKTDKQITEPIQHTWNESNIVVIELPLHLASKIRKSHLRKMEFLNDINEVKKIIETDIPKSDTHNNIEIEIDYSDSSIAEKIIFLNELGIIKYLRDKYIHISNNRLATLISGITGENKSTIQSYINPIINEYANQDKSPYSHKGTLDKVTKRIGHLNLRTE